MVAPDEDLKKEIVKKAITLYNTLSPVSKALEKEFHEFSYMKKLKDGDILLEQAEICRSFYFVGKGALIGESKKDSKKITVWLCNAGDSCTSVSGMYGTTISEESIYAYGEAHLLVVDNTVITAWYKKYPEFNIIMRKMFEYYLKSSQERASMLRMGTARQKYAYFKYAYPGYAEAISVDIIASFLGMKTSTLAFVIKEEEKHLNRESDLNDKYQILLTYLETSKCYLLTSLNLAQLANHLQLTPHTLSEIINKKSSKNFNDFINSYRVAYVQERLQIRENWKHLKLAYLGLEAGFKSRSTFFSVFKKHVGVSPLAYINSLSSLK